MGNKNALAFRFDFFRRYRNAITKLQLSKRGDPIHWSCKRVLPCRMACWIRFEQMGSEIMTREPILSIHPEFAEAIFAGKKRVEFRRRPVAIPESGRVWIYATKPTAGVLGFIEVKQVVCDGPATFGIGFRM